MESQPNTNTALSDEQSGSASHDCLPDGSGPMVNHNHNEGEDGAKGESNKGGLSDDKGQEGGEENSAESKESEDEPLQQQQQHQQPRDLEPNNHVLVPVSKKRVKTAAEHRAV